MSLTTIKAVWPGERAEDFVELENSWGAAPYVWEAMAKRYLPPGKNWLVNHELIWPLSKDPRVPRHQQAVLRMTYDNCLLYAKDYQKAADDIEWFFRNFGQPDPNGAGAHWLVIHDVIRTATCPALGFHWTSVSEDPFDGGYDDDDLPLPLDWSKFWDVYEIPENTETASSDS